MSQRHLHANRFTLPNTYEVTHSTQVQIATLKEILGRTRYRIALYRYGKGLTEKEIGWRLKMGRRMVLKHIAIIDKAFSEARHAQCGHRVQPSGVSEPYQASLN